MEFSDGTSASIEIMERAIIETLTDDPVKIQEHREGMFMAMLESVQDEENKRKRLDSFMRQEREQQTNDLASRLGSEILGQDREPEM